MIQKAYSPCVDVDLTKTAAYTIEQEVHRNLLLGTQRHVGRDKSTDPPCTRSRYLPRAVYSALKLCRW